MREKIRKTDENGRCVECGLIPRSDIARAMGEKSCRCDKELNRIQDSLQGFLRQNDENIKKLAERLSDRDPTE
jgi:hypothetical protein